MTFPALIPSGRRFTPGTFPHTNIPTMAGLSARVRHGDVRINQTVALEFIALTESQMLEILDHYRDREGRFLSFDLPEDIWSGTATPEWFTPDNYRWLYRNPPQVEEIPTGTQSDPSIHFNVSVELEAIPPEGATVSGARWRTIDSFVGGAVDSGDRLATGATWETEETFVGGAASGT
jgi:hypothetical protein